MEERVSEKNEIKEVFLNAIETLREGYQGNSLTDLFVQIDCDNGEILIFDDEGNEISDAVISVWEERGNSDIAYEELMSRNLKALKHVVSDLNKDDAFDVLDTFKPFSISLTDDDSVVIEELLVIDDESVVFLEDDFLEKLEKDFDDFVNNLLKD